MQDPKPSVEELYDTAERHYQAGNLSYVEDLCRHALAVDPNHAGSLNLLGLVAHRMGRNEIAVALITKAIGTNPNIPAYHNNHAVALHAQGRWGEAEAAYRAALSLDPAFLEAHNNIGNLLLAVNRLDEAVEHYRQALVLRPHIAELHNNMAKALRLQGKSGEAIAFYRQAVALDPTFFQALYNLGVVLQAEGSLDEAVAFYNRALALNPNYGEAHNNLGVCLQSQGKLIAALNAYRRAVSIQPASSIFHGNLGSVLSLLGRFDDAAQSCQRAVMSDSSELAGSGLLYTLSYHPTLPAAEIARAFCEWGDRVLLKTKRVSPRLRPRSAKPLRVGYVSPDFRRHTTRFYLSPLLENHDRSEFELYAYSNVRRPDEFTNRFQLLFDSWTEITALDDDIAAQIVATHDLDVLVDVTNHMADHRLGIFARKPAPIQATWLGTCWTTGLATMDYAILDPFMAPEGCDSLFRERIIRLPHTLFCYRPDEIDDAISPPPAERNAFVTFGYTGRSERLNHLVYSAWAAILKKIPTARLLLDFVHFGDAETGRWFLDQLAVAGIEPGRVLLRHSPSARQALADVDIILDSFPHSGGSMLFDAIWSGVPCVTLSARPPVGRVGTCILSNLGLTDWIASSVDAYVEIATTKAAQLTQLSRLRVELRKLAEQSPLTDAPEFARAMERAYRQMVETRRVQG